MAGYRGEVNEFDGEEKHHGYLTRRGHTSIEAWNRSAVSCLRSAGSASSMDVDTARCMKQSAAGLVMCAEKRPCSEHGVGSAVVDWRLAKNF